MSLGRRLISTGGAAACTTDSTDPFGDSSGVALYNLDYDASDASGNYDGTPTDVDFGVGGQINYGARFNGSSSAIVVPNNILTTNDHSVSMWFNLDDTNGIQTVVEFDYENRILFRAVSTDSNLAYVGNSGYFNHGITFSAGQWYHLVITFSAGNPFKIYVDGVLSYTGGNTNILAQNNDNIIGASNSSGANGVDGKIDQVRFFTKELNSTEVDSLFAEEACVYTATTTDNYYPLADGSSDAVAYYKLDNSAEDSVSTNDGTESNIEYRFGRFGQAAVFNGTDSALDTNVTISGTADYSCSLWVNLEDDGTRVSLISLYTGFGASSTILYAPLSTTSNPDEWYFSSKNTDVFYGPSIKFGQWQHVVLTYDHSITTFTIYIDKVSIGTSVASSATNQDLIIGAINASGTNSAKGLIDQVRVYSTALTSDQVTELYNEKPETDTSTFKTVLYEGNSSTQYISNVGFSPDLVWIKRRTTTATDHVLMDTIREQYLISNKTNAQASYGSVFDFNHLGFDLNGSSSSFNLSGDDYVAWCWKAGGDAVTGTGTGVTNVSISANTDAGFSIVKYTGSGAAGMNFGHGLTEAIPELVIIKNLDNSTNWQVFGGSLFTRMQLDQTGGDDGNFGLTITSTTIQTTQVSGQEGNSAWNATDDYIAYIWHSVSGYSKIGSYTGNGTTSKVVSDPSFEPSFVMIKRTDSTSNWRLFDNRRGTDLELYANSNSQDVSATGYINFNSNGFEITTSGGWLNELNGSYLYMAFK